MTLSEYEGLDAEVMVLVDHGRHDYGDRWDTHRIKMPLNGMSLCKVRVHKTDIVMLVKD